MLNQLDRVLEERGGFGRYANDCLIFVKSGMSVR